MVKKNQQWLPLGSGSGDYLRKGMRELSRVMFMLHILIRVWVDRCIHFVNCHQIVHIRLVHFIV